MCKGFLIDGYDVRATFGLAVASWVGYRDSPQASYPTVVVPGRVGEVVSDPVARERALTLTLQGTILGASAAAARTALDNLQWLLARSSVRVTVPDDPSRELVCKPVSCVVAPAAARVVDPLLPLTIVLTAPDPYKRDTTDQVVTPVPSGAPLACPVGTGPVRPKLTMVAAAACNSVNWNLFDSTGTLRGEIHTLGALVAGDVVVIDNDARTITKNGVDYLGALSSGDFLEIRPEYGDRLSGASPTLASGWTPPSPVGSSEVRYRRRWR